MEMTLFPWKLPKKCKRNLKRLSKTGQRISTRILRTHEKIFFVACILISAIILYRNLGPPLTLIHRSIHVAMMLALTFLMSYDQEI